MQRAESVLIAASMVLYAAGFLLPLASLLTGRERAFAVGRWATVAGLATHTAALGIRWAVEGHVPIATPHENGSVGAWSIVVFALAGARGRTYRSSGVGAVALALLILGWATTQDSAHIPFVASLRSVWLYVHVSFAFLAYASFSIASGTALVYLIKERRGEAGVLSRVPPLEELDRTEYRYVVFGFITCAVMIAAGAIWAKDLWGAYWSWDPVETWSLVSWLGYGILIHLRSTYGWTGRRFAWFALLAVSLVIVAYFGVTSVFKATQHVFTVPAPPTF